MKWLVLYFVLLLSAAAWYKDAKCGAKTEGLGTESRFSFIGGCQVKVGKNWVPLENYRVTETDDAK